LRAPAQGGAACVSREISLALTFPFSRSASATPTISHKGTGIPTTTVQGTEMVMEDMPVSMQGMRVSMPGMPALTAAVAAYIEPVTSPPGKM
jgi:hypothetical protein